MINLRTATIAGVGIGAAAGIGFAAKSTGTTDKDLGTASVLAGGAVAATVGGVFTSRYAGPQIQYTRAKGQIKEMHARQLQVFEDLKSGSILKYDQGKYLQESAKEVNDAVKAMMAASAPKKPIVLAAAAAGAALLGGVAVWGGSKLED